MSEMDRSTRAYLWAAGCGAFFILIFMLSLAYDKPAAPAHPPAAIKPAAMPPIPPKPPPTKAELAKAKTEQRKAQETQRKTQAEAMGRMLACRELESYLVNAGYDASVTLMSDNNRNMVIYGPGISRLMARQMATRSSARNLKSIGFTTVTFMRSKWDWVGEWNVVDHTIRLTGD